MALISWTLDVDMPVPLFKDSYFLQARNKDSILVE